MTQQQDITLDPQHLRAVAVGAGSSPWVPDDGDVVAADGSHVASRVTPAHATFIATFDPATVLALLDLAFPDQRPAADERVEWAVDYQDGLPPRPAGYATVSSEDQHWVAGTWATAWNGNLEPGERHARRVPRTVTTTAWTPDD